MLATTWVLDRVKQRRRNRQGGRAATVAPLWTSLLWSPVLWSWKALRRVPGLNRVVVPLAKGPHTLCVRLFSYDDLLVASSNYERCLAQIEAPLGGIVVDAGAFIGTHALDYARQVGPSGRVIAVEPVPDNWRLLQRNVRRNQYEHVDCVPCALSEAEGQVTLCFDHETSVASRSGKGRRRIDVRCRRLDDVLSELGISRIDLLKIDVEGEELPVLQGSERVLAASPAATLVVEIHSSQANKLCPVRSWLKQRGYTIEEMKEDRRRFYVARR